MVNFTTDRLLLREFEMSDIPHLEQYQQNPLYLEHYDSPPDSRRIVEAAIDWSKNLPRLNYQLAICFGNPAVPIGSIGLRRYGYPEHEAEVGFELDPNYWGKGYAKEALAEMFAFAKAQSLQILHSVTNQSNLRAKGLIKSIGFRSYKEQGNDVYYSVAL